MSSAAFHKSDDRLSYPHLVGLNDEVYTAEGDVRQHWEYVLESMTSLGRNELTQRQLKAQRILRDDGAAYTPVDQPANINVWELDPVPMLFESDEWNRVESGLIERAELLDLILKDLYGEQSLIRHGFLPPELVYGQAGFLRACHDVKVPGKKQLIFHSSDMIRRSDGEICILTDRTQVPRGIGYVLENRTVMSRVFPSLYRDSQVHRLALFFHSIRKKLHELSPRAAHGEPSVVLLTPGAYSKSYFEHIYLANYLGFPLVQGGDLTVRGGRVWMKSVEGLNPVDVIFRFVDDAFCDPVELRNDSHLGVPGLLEAMRNGNVVVVNPPGAAVLENPVLHKYLPRISEFFFGHPLKLNSVNAYWCGDAADLEFVMTHFDQLVLKTISPNVNEKSVFLSELSETDRDAWRAQVLKRPRHFVAQDFLEPSQSPTWVSGELQPRRILMRAFSVASEQSFNVMPGSLARIAHSRRSLRVGHGTGSVSKDTWVLASEPEKQFTLQNDAAQRVLDQAFIPTNLPSRVVENLFWMGRYAERSECSARLLRTVFLQLNSTLHLPDDARRLLLETVTDLTLTEPGFRGEDAAELIRNPDRELLSMILDGKRVGTLRHSLHAMLSSAEEVKEQLSADAQRIVNDIRDEMGNQDRALALGLNSAPEETLDQLVTELLAFAGQAHEGMFRGTGWNFLEMGRQLEKVCQSAALIRAMLVPALQGRSQEIALETLLLVTEALIPYRRRYQASLDIGNGLQLMLMDRKNPRSLLFLMTKLGGHLQHLKHENAQEELNPEQKKILSATTMLQLVDPKLLDVVNDKNQVRYELDHFLLSLQEQVFAAADCISDRYFDHTGGPQQLVQDGWERT